MSKKVPLIYLAVTILGILILLVTHEFAAPGRMLHAKERMPLSQAGDIELRLQGDTPLLSIRSSNAFFSSNVSGNLPLTMRCTREGRPALVSELSIAELPSDDEGCFSLEHTHSRWSPNGAVNAVALYASQQVRLSLWQEGKWQWATTLPGSWYDRTMDDRCGEYSDDGQSDHLILRPLDTGKVLCLQDGQLGNECLLFAQGKVAARGTLPISTGTGHAVYATTDGLIAYVIDGQKQLTCYRLAMREGTITFTPVYTTIARNPFRAVISAGKRLCTWNNDVYGPQGVLRHLPPPHGVEWWNYGWRMDADSTTVTQWNPYGGGQVSFYHPETGTRWTPRGWTADQQPISITPDGNRALRRCATRNGSVYYELYQRPGKRLIRFHLDMKEDESQPAQVCLLADGKTILAVNLGDNGWELLRFQWQ